MKRMYRRLTRFAWLGAAFVTSCGGPDDQTEPTTRTRAQAMGSGVALTTDVPIASGSAVSNGRIAINAYAAGAVDIAWAGEGTVRYSNWIADGTPDGDLVVPNENVGGQSDDVMGIARHNGVVTIGMDNAQSIREATRGSGSWTISDTGVDNPRLQPPAGAYAVNPTTGHGAFVTHDPNNDIVFIHETSPGVWDTDDVLDASGEAGNGSSWGQFNSLLFTPTGTPIAAYKTTGPTAIKAGAVPVGGGAVTTVDTTAYAMRHTALAQAADGTLYLLDNQSNADTRLYTSDDDGTTWSHVGQIINVGKSGEFHDYRIAVAPDESLIAALVYDAIGSGAKLTLATSKDRGATWQYQSLPGDPGPQIGDVAFDPEGRLFVSYYRADDDTLHLLATSAPQIPYQIVSIAVGGEVSAGRIALNVYAAGAVDIAWADQSSTVRYSNWIWDGATRSGQLPVNGEIVGGPSDDIMGISRHNDVVTIGMNAGQNIQEATRGSGSWTITDTNVDNPRLQPPGGAYAVDPATGYGAFVTHDLNHDIVFIKEGATGWPSPAAPDVLDPSGDSGTGASWGQFNSLLYTAAGVPIATYKTTGPTAIKAGPIPTVTGQPVPTVDTTAYAMRHTALAQATDGTLYLLDNRSNTDTRLYTSDDGGASWAHVGPIIDVGKSGEFHDYKIAVAPDESLLAALVYDDTGSSAELTLATSTDAGVTWQYQSLYGEKGPPGPQLADLAFDPQGRLYVAYYVSADDKLYLLVNVQPVNEFEVIVTTDDSGFSKTGAWSPGTNPGSQSTYVYQAVVNGTHEAEWRFTLPSDGHYRVYAHWTTNPNRAKDSPYTVHYAGGLTKTVRVNQEVDGFEWVRLGIFDFDAGESKVVLSADATADPPPTSTTVVIADAIKVVAAQPLSPIGLVVGTSEATYTTHQVAHETAEMMRPMTGLDFQVRRDDTAATDIAIGVPSDFPSLSFAELDPTDLLRQDEYVLRSHAGGIHLVGATPRAARFAAADLFQRWGHRQFFPGTNWEILPYFSDIDSAITGHDVIGQPSVPVRSFPYDYGMDAASVEPFDKWALANRAVSTLQIGSTHGFGGLYNENKAFFNDTAGRRAGFENGQGTGQICIHDPTVRSQLVTWVKEKFDASPELNSFSMEPLDGGEWCDDGSGDSISDQMVRFANHVQDALVENGHGDKIIGILAYNDHYPPPTTEFVNANVAVKVTTTHKRGGFSHAEALAGWRAQMDPSGPKLLGAYEYQSIFPWTEGRPGEGIGADLLNVETTMRGWGSTDGVKEALNQISDDWGGYGLGYYLAARVQWDANANFDQLLDDFFDKSFGSARAPMEQLFHLLFRFEQDEPTGRRYILSEDLIRRAYGHLNDARQSYEGDSQVLERIYDMVLYTRYMDLYRRYLVAHDSAAPCTPPPLPPDPLPPAGPRQAPFEEWVAFSYRLNASARMLIHYRAISTTINSQQPLLALFDPCLNPMPTPASSWQDDAPFTAEEMDQLIVDGMANNALIAFTPVTYGSDLVSTAPMYQRAVPAGTVSDTGLGVESYTWVPSISSTEPEVRLAIKGGLTYSDRGNVRVTLYRIDPAGGPDIFVVEDQTTPPDKTEHVVELEAQQAGLHKVVIDSQGSRTEASFAEHQSETISARDFDVPTLGDGWSLYFYVPKNTSVVAGFSSDNTQGEILRPDGTAALTFSSLLATSGSASHFSVSVPQDTDGQIWKFHNCKGRRVLMTVPPYLARHEDKLLLPQAVVTSDPGTPGPWTVEYSNDLVSAAPLGLAGAPLDTTVFNRDRDGRGFFTWLAPPTPPATTTDLAMTASSRNSPTKPSPPADAGTPETLYLHLLSGRPGEDDLQHASPLFDADTTLHPVTLTSSASGLHRVRVFYVPQDSAQVNLTAGGPRTFPAGPHLGWDDSEDWSKYFYVPKGTEVVGGYVISEPNKGIGKLYDATGYLVKDLADVISSGHLEDYFDADATGRDGQLWKCVGCSGKLLLMTVPPYMADSAAELLLPLEVVTADTQ